MNEVYDCVSVHTLFCYYISNNVFFSRTRDVKITNRSPPYTVTEGWIHISTQIMTRRASLLILGSPMDQYGSSTYGISVIFVVVGFFHQCFGERNLLILLIHCNRLPPPTHPQHDVTYHMSRLEVGLVVLFSNLIFTLSYRRRLKCRGKVECQSFF